ncbi:hypothetical protein [Burkholderia thailandensis]|uniref:hypothetical protein n=1 Tax=Burkholderia thailandensis TaxID=57975 RepID=UPI00107ED24F|nr:hypothetical protein [Burkholderia thailandensis]TGB34389.1 hypothetical protein C6946_07110 [Burkholderia thailandensis]
MAKYNKGMENIRPRASSYKPEYAQLARNYALRGATIEELGPLLGVTGRTIKNWKKAYPEFEQAIKDGNQHADAKVIGRAFDKCMEGDSTMLIFWLKNRLGWRDRIDTVAKIGISPIDELLSEVEGTTFKPKDGG